MQTVTPCNHYAARPAGTATYRNEQHQFKVYYVDIYGRSEPERYEWDLCGRHRDTVLAGLQQIGIEGLGAVVAFPHITKVFRFAPNAETVMHVRAFWTADFSDVDLNQDDGFMEFACYAEAIIAAEEYRFWAEAATAGEYLEHWVEWNSAAIKDNTKLGRYFAPG